MRKNIKTDKPITITCPIWHVNRDMKLSRLDYDRPMVRIELRPGTYSCEMLEKLIIKGADIDKDTIKYLKKLGYCPGVSLEDEFDGISTYLDPEDELN